MSSESKRTNVIVKEKKELTPDSTIDLFRGIEPSDLFPGLERIAFPVKHWLLLLK